MRGDGRAVPAENRGSDRPGGQTADERTMMFRLVGVPGAEAALAAVRARLAAGGYDGGSIGSADADEETPALLVDAGGDGSWAELQRLLGGLVQRGTPTLVVLDDGRGSELAGEAFRQGAADLLLWPRDADFLQVRLEALLSRRWTLRWPTSVQSELRLVHAITLAISEADSFVTAMGAVLSRICEATGWVLGQAWVRRMATGELECSPAWHSRHAGLESFRRVTEGMTFDLGVGLPGRVWATGQRMWLNDVSVEACFRRAAA